MMTAIEETAGGVSHSELATGVTTRRCCHPTTKCPHDPPQAQVITCTVNRTCRVTALHVTVHTTSVAPVNNVTHTQPLSPIHTKHVHCLCHSHMYCGVAGIYSMEWSVSQDVVSEGTGWDKLCTSCRIYLYKLCNINGTPP